MKQQLKNLGQHVCYSLLSLIILIPLLAYANTQYRKIAIFNSTVDSSTLGASSPSTIAGTTLKINTGITNGPGFQYLSGTTCTVPAGTNSFCAGNASLNPITWPVPFVDANYAVACTIVSNTVYLVGLQAKTATGVMPLIQQTPGNAGAVNAPITCIGIHEN